MMDLEHLKQKKYIGLGCSTFGGSSSKRVAHRILNHSFDRGIIYYDVARSYGYGLAESIVGEFAKNKRDKIILATKFGILPPDIPFKSLVISTVRQLKKFIPKSKNAIQQVSGAVLNNHVFTPALARQSLDKSLKELKTDYVDILLFHESRYSDMLLDDVRDVLEKEKQKGKLRIYGGTFENREDLLSVLEKPTGAQAVQFPFRLDEGFSNAAKKKSHIKVVYSILSSAKSLNADGASIINKVNVEFPELGFLKTVSELMLFLAQCEIESGVLLMSTTKSHHIDRNQSIFNEPVLLGQRLGELKKLLRNLINANVQPGDL